jgi:S-adenosylmethionine synthetase
MSVLVDTFGTGVIPDEKIVELVVKNFDLRPAGIISTLDLKRPIYQPTAAYGHFGRQPEDGKFPWEKSDQADKLRKEGW